MTKKNSVFIPSYVIASVEKATLNERAFENLRGICRAKESLFKKAFKTDSLNIEETEDKYIFPWFYQEAPGDLDAYTLFIKKLCDLSKSLKRVNPKEDRVVENEKYAFRCFLLRIGLIGDQYKAARKVLLRNLSGSAAFKSGGKS